MENISYLPLGSVVYLKEGAKKLMVVARGLVLQNGDERLFFDYGGVLYPEGLQDQNMAYFQHDAITKVVFEGYRDMDDEAMVDRINDFAAKLPDIKRGDVSKLRAQPEN